MRYSQSVTRLARSLYEYGIKAELGIVKGKRLDLDWHYFRLAAILGDREAQFTLALKYATGMEGRKNRRLSMAWFKRAALAGEELCKLVSSKQNSTPQELIQLFEKIFHSNI